MRSEHYTPNLMIVLHGHLPYVRHPDHPFFFEENWLFEAVTGSYIPLLDMLERLASDGVPSPVTLSLSPTLIEMLGDRLLRNRCAAYIDERIELAELEIVRTRRDAPFRKLARFYKKRFEWIRHLYEDVYRRDMAAAFGRLHRAGVIELITSAATHGYLPYLAMQPESVRAQVGIGVDLFRSKFKRPPKGIWIPECGYFNGLDAHLRREGINYFFLDAHGLMFGSPAPQNGFLAPALTPEGVAAFGRDPFSSRLVWDMTGYPGDADYREFHRDIGFDLPIEQVGRFIRAGGGRGHTGIKYCRITGSEAKEPYNPAAALAKAKLHARHFVDELDRRMSSLSFMQSPPPVSVCTYDAELFGHWWFEGPSWLEHLFRQINRRKHLRAVTASAYLDEYGEMLETVAPAQSSWGDGGYGAVWLDKSNDWIYPVIHHAAETMIRLADAHHHPDGLLLRALDQAARELLLAQSSDWPFLISRNTASEYAASRVGSHIDRFNRIAEMIKRETVNKAELLRYEQTDNIFRRIRCMRYFLPADPRTDTSSNTRKTSRMCGKSSCFCCRPD